LQILKDLSYFNVLGVRRGFEAIRPFSHSFVDSLGREQSRVIHIDTFIAFSSILYQMSQPTSKEQYLWDVDTASNTCAVVILVKKLEMSAGGAIW